MSRRYTCQDLLDRMPYVTETHTYTDKLVTRVKRLLKLHHREEDGYCSCGRTACPIIIILDGEDEP